jgi:PAS domain S-box-containing protein
MKEKQKALASGFIYAPFLLLAGLLAGFYVGGSPASHESGAILLVLNIALTTVVAIFIAALAGRSFLLTGRPALLAICVGMIVWGASAFVAVIGEHVGNYNLTIHNLGLAVSAVCHLWGAVVARRDDARSMRAAGAWLAIGVSLGLTTVGAIWMGTIEHWLPLFFIDGVGSTLVRSLVLASAITLFAFSAALTWNRYRVSGWRFLLWYSVGLGLIALGAIGLMVQPTYGSWLGWVARLTQYLGGIYMLIGTVITVHESGRWQLSTEERLARSEQSLREQAELLEVAHDAIIVRQMDGVISYWNQGAQEMYGWSASEAIGRVIYELLQTGFQTPLTAIEAELQQAGRWEGVLNHASKAGDRIVVASRWVLRKSKPGTAAIMEINRDITEQQRSEESLKVADRRKDEFLATLAHELRNPLAPIRNAVTILDSPATDEAQRRWGRDVIARQVKHMALLLDDLLDVSRITRGNLQLKKSIVDLRAVIDSAVEIAKPLIDSKQHRLTVDIPSGSCRLEIDSLRIAQVLANLLTNAAKFTPFGGALNLTATIDDRAVVLSVKDTGIGLSAESIPHLFTLFSQVGSTATSRGAGLGIGLALVKGLVELHGGRIEARSAGLGCGSEFVLWLPRSEVAREPDRVERRAQWTAAVDGTNRDKLLVADDNSDGVETLAKFLRISGFDVVNAYSGDEAWQLAQRERPAALLLDIGMPGLSGYDVAHRVREAAWGSRTVLIAITGWGQLHDKHKARTAGFDAHFTKPADPDELAACLKELLASRKAKRSLETP